MNLSVLFNLKILILNTNTLIHYFSYYSFIIFSTRLKKFVILKWINLFLLNGLNALYIFVENIKKLNERRKKSKDIFIEKK